MVVDLVPTAEVLSDVLPSERLLANGVAIPKLRASFRYISNWREVWGLHLC
jgi:hypothetical protein